MASLGSVRTFTVLVALLLPLLVLSAECPKPLTIDSCLPGNGSCCSNLLRGRFNRTVAAKHRLESLDSKDNVPSKWIPRGLLRGRHARNITECRLECNSRAECAIWNFIEAERTCLLYRTTVCTSEGADIFLPDAEGSFVGVGCRPEDPTAAAEVVTAVDVLPEKAFCLLSDANLHVNMKLSGYLDERTTGATTVKEGKAVRTWIRELGVMWRRGGRNHSLRLTARRGELNSRGDGFLESIQVDGITVPRLLLGDELKLYDGQASVTYDTLERAGTSDVEVFRVWIDGTFEAELRLQTAHSLLQRPDDAEVHLNMDILEFHHSEDVHGVLGQLYRNNSSERALNYNTLAELMYGSGTAVKSSVNGTGGDTLRPTEAAAAGFMSSSVLASDCQFSRYTSGPA